MGRGGKALWQQVQELPKANVIRRQIYDWAEAARWIGNHGAHDTEPDTSNGKLGVTNVTKGDADAMLQLVPSSRRSTWLRPEEQLEKRNKQPNKVR